MTNWGDRGGSPCGATIDNLEKRIAELEGQVDLDRKHTDSQARVFEADSKRIAELEDEIINQLLEAAINDLLDSGGGA